ncbi:hypothetical protein PHYPSEUDO_002565 [Phytophthora pseudosyringae]|uniref:SLC26A/SulP transporter domain-containing protein n=1 Tax=Phytophthora pseudosyringae TaxID=221518 RepID=A0A8T1VX31_9STRA|nr:hypothetical protein PHYPSEUDO_002565 [Phytophthora pseudosyringae]
MAFLSDRILLVVRLLNLSQLADFFSLPVMGGFVSAGGLLIMLSQTFKHISSTNVTVFAVAANSIVCLFAGKLIKKNYFLSPMLMQLFESPLKEEEKASMQTNGTPAHTIHSHGFSFSKEQ